MITFDKLGSYGRMGNALFQASATISLAMKLNTDYAFPHWEYEDFFNIPKEKFTDNLPKNQKQYPEPYFHYKSFPQISNLNLVGYYQTEKYIEDKACIKNLMTPKYDFPMLPGVTGMHVRRTDYLKFPDCHPVLSMDYYNKAMELIPSKNYVIFSDDIQWCKDNFKGSQFTFSENNSPPLDLYLFSRCENNIIANSSFSWWGAWLNPNENKKIIAPKNWFGPALKHDTKDLIPKEWQCL